MPTQNIDVTLKQHNKLDICTKKKFSYEKKDNPHYFSYFREFCCGGKIKQSQSHIMKNRDM